MSGLTNRLIPQLRVALCALILVSVFCPGWIMHVWAELPSDLVQGIGVLSEYKSNAEQQAQFLVVMAADGDINKDDYRNGQSLYAEAKAGFDGWIDQLVFEIQSGTTEASASNHESIQAKAKTKGDKFTRYVQEQLRKDNRGGEIGDAFKSFFESINDVAISIVKGFSKVSATDKPEVIKKLEGYKWSEFHSIEQGLQ